MHPVGDAVTRVVVISGLIVLVGAVLLVTHLRRGLALPEWKYGVYGPVGRVAQSYAAAVCFISVLIAALAFVASGYELCRLIAPGVFESSGPNVAIARTIISSLYLPAGRDSGRGRSCPHSAEWLLGSLVAVAKGCRRPSLRRPSPRRCSCGVPPRRRHRPNIPRPRDRHLLRRLPGNHLSRILRFLILRLHRRCRLSESTSV